MCLLLGLEFFGIRFEKFILCEVEASLFRVPGVRVRVER